MSEDPRRGLRAQLQIDTPQGPLLGAQRVALLEAIGRHGSIARAAKVVGIGYKAAWDAVDDMNMRSPQVLTQSASGGVHGGGSTLTPYGRRSVAFYRALEAEYRVAARRLEAALDDVDALDVPQFQTLLRRFSMQTSARNQWMGTVESLRTDGVEALVELRLNQDHVVRAVVTAESIDRMGLRPGVEACALVKSSSVMLTHLEPEQISVRNSLRARVLRMQRGSVNAEVVLQPGDAQLQIVAVITDESARRLGVRPGVDMVAFFKASSVSLAVTR